MSLQLLTPPEAGACNTQLFAHNRFTSSLDWFQGTLSYSGDTDDLPKAIASELCTLTSTEPVWADDGPKYLGRLYNHHSTSPNGLIVAYNAPTDGFMALGQIIVVIPGRVWSSLTPELQDEVILTLNRYGVKCTRIDLRVDDRDSYLKPEMFHQAWEQGHIKGHMTYQACLGRRPGDGFTVYLGSKNSDTRVRIYDKTKQSKGEVIGVRLEVQWRRKRAQAVFTNYCKVTQNVKKLSLLKGNRHLLIDETIINLVTGAIDFRERNETKKNFFRCRRCEWWETFINDLNAEPEIIHIPTPITTLEDKKAWIERSVSQTLALVESCEGIKSSQRFLKDVIAKAKRKLNPKNQAIVRCHLRQKYGLVS